jgi:hypothetical protein
MMRQKSARSSFRQPTILQFLLATLFLPGIAAFTTSPYSVCRESLPCSSGRGFLCASNGQNEEPPNEKKKYKFGDITQSLVTRVTKKKNYKFGDLSRALDQSAKNKVAKLRGKDQYEFGDLSKYIDSKVKEQVNDFTKKDLYKFGDITEEIIKRIKNRDYSLEDMIILLKILLAFGAGLTPVAQFLPAKLLIEALDVSIAGDLGNKFIAEITKELDRRMKMAFTGSPDYQLGDLSKKAVLKYIGKDE